MSAEDKEKLDGIYTEAWSFIIDGVTEPVEKYIVVSKNPIIEPTSTTEEN